MYQSYIVIYQQMQWYLTFVDTFVKVTTFIGKIDKSVIKSIEFYKIKASKFVLKWMIESFKFTLNTSKRWTTWIYIDIYIKISMKKISFFFNVMNKSYSMWLTYMYKAYIIQINNENVKTSTLKRRLTQI